MVHPHSLSASWLLVATVPCALATTVLPQHLDACGATVSHRWLWGTLGASWVPARD